VARSVTIFGLQMEVEEEEQDEVQNSSDLGVQTFNAECEKMQRAIRLRGAEATVRADQQHDDIHLSRLCLGTVLAARHGRR
jgi:hypothetical protein